VIGFDGSERLSKRGFNRCFTFLKETSSRNSRTTAATRSAMAATVSGLVVNVDEYFE